MPLRHPIPKALRNVLLLGDRRYLVTAVTFWYALLFVVLEATGDAIFVFFIGQLLQPVLLPGVLLIFFVTISPLVNVLQVWGMVNAGGGWWSPPVPTLPGVALIFGVVILVVFAVNWLLVRLLQRMKW